MHHKLKWIIPGLLTAMLGCGGHRLMAPEERGSERIVPGAQLGPNTYRFESTISKRVSIPYLLYLPEDYERVPRPWPLLMFLHGAGERGNDLSLVKVHGPPKLIEQGKRFPFIVLAPQCPQDGWWDIEALKALLDSVLAAHRVDERRIYLTGLSMGGYGTWDLAITYPQRFAAIAPICGGSGRGPLVEKLKEHNVPVWTFHGAKDQVVPISETEYLVRRLKAHGGDVKFTVFPDIAHDAWNPAYDNPALYEWLLSQRRS